MTKQELDLFSKMIKRAETEAILAIEVLCREHPTIMPFSLSEFECSDTSFPRVESEGIFVTYYWRGSSEEDIYEFPLSILTPEGVEEYVKEKILEKLKKEEAKKAENQKREKEKSQNEYQEYLRLKEKFESEDEVKNAD